jgi:hypothetical protein
MFIRFSQAKARPLTGTYVSGVGIDRDDWNYRAIRNSQGWNGRVRRGPEKRAGRIVAQKQAQTKLGWITMPRWFDPSRIA